MRDVQRSLTPEIMDGTGIPDDILHRFHADLRLIHRLMGNAGQIMRRIKGARSVIDVGCGDGELLAEIREKMGVLVTGVDLRPQPGAKVPVLQLDATTDELPRADAAVSMMVIHHLTDEQVVALIRNVGRSCDRFVFLDPVRRRLPLVLYTVFFCPLLSRVGTLDGQQSIRRAYTGKELKVLVERALGGTGATFRHWVSRFGARQILDITYRP
jgi:SAM-dependent methyltransferase